MADIDKKGENMKNYCREFNVTLNKSNFLGKGMFSKAYKVGEKVIVLTEDPAKECLFMFCQFNNKHLPKLEILDSINGKQAYSMPFYYPLKASNKKAWSQYKAIKDIIDTMPYYKKEKHVCFESYEQAFQESTLDKELKEGLISLVSNMANYTDCIFLEISPRNAKVDSEGNLILLDIIGDTKSLERKRKWF